MNKQKVPTYKELMNPTLKALRELGGSGTNEEIAETVIDQQNYSEEIASIPHKEEGSKTEVEYRIAWAKTYLKKFGLLENSERGVWALTSEGWEQESVDSDEVAEFVKEEQKKKDDDLEEEEKKQEEWRDRLHDFLMDLSPEGFERLCKRLLRESGFVEVSVTSSSSDEGIDGKGILKLSDLLSFHVVFQAKRWKNSVGPSVIRDFRGSMQGRADKGFIITTSSFTRKAKEEATRDGATPIDLVDGDRLEKMLKDHRIGVEVEEEIQENVDVKENYFQSIDED